MYVYSNYRIIPASRLTSRGVQPEILVVYCHQTSGSKSINQSLNALRAWMANVTLRQNTEFFKNDHIFHLQKTYRNRYFYLNLVFIMVVEMQFVVDLIFKSVFAFYKGHELKCFKDKLTLKAVSWMKTVEKELFYPYFYSSKKIESLHCVWCTWLATKEVWFNFIIMKVKQTPRGMVMFCYKIMPA